jgi:hypothetical protein
MPLVDHGSVRVVVNAGSVRLDMEPIAPPPTGSTGFPHDPNLKLPLTLKWQPLPSFSKIKHSTGHGKRGRVNPLFNQIWRWNGAEVVFRREKQSKLVK